MKGLHGKKSIKPFKRRRTFPGALIRMRNLVFIGLLIMVVAGIFLSIEIYNASSKIFPVKEVVFYGNKHLSDTELRSMAGDSDGKGLLAISAKSISDSLLKSAWIKGVSIRKEFPDRISVKVYEASPFAILETKGRAFLVDDKGRMLEEIKGDSVPFLPVITADPFKSQDNFREALSLAKAVKEKKIATERSRVEIIADKGKENLSMIVDNVVIKVGSGDYEQKLQRLFELEEEIKKRDIAVDYVDLRFANRVVVKPISEVVR